MNYLDILIAVPLLWGLYKGITRGLIVEAATLAAFFLAVWVSVHFTDWLTGLFSDGTPSQHLPIICFAVLFIGVLVLVFFVAKMAEKAVKAGGIGWLNKIGGAVFGTLKFALIISLLIFIYEAIERSYPMIGNDTKNGSLLYEPVSKVAPAVIPGLEKSEVSKLILSDSVRVTIPLKQD